MAILTNVITVSASSVIGNFQRVTYVGASSLTLTMPQFDGININENTRFTVVIPAGLGITGTVLDTVDGSLFDPSGLTTLSLTAEGQYDLCINNGRWYVQLFTVSTGGGGGITDLTGDVTGTGPGSTATTIANNAVTTAKMVQLSAYKFWGNDTNASANAAEHDFRDEGETAITATITFTGTTAPSGASTLSQWFLRVGDTVFYKFFLTYATASTATTVVTIAFPSQFPTPLLPTGLTGASQFLYFMDYSRAITTPSGSLTSNASGALKRNAGNTANEFVFSLASGNYRTFHMGGSYKCS